MRRVLIALLILAATVPAADARHRHRHGFFLRMRAAPVFLAAPEAAQAYRMRGREMDGEQLVPADWKLEPASPDWKGRRYLAPDGSAWLAFYATAAADDAAAHLKNFAFVDGEE